MSVAPSSARRTKQLTKSECEKWAAAPNVNPLTNREIAINGRTYKAIAKLCQKNSGIMPGASAKRLPESIGTWPVPQTRDEWSKPSPLHTRFKRLCTACRQYGFITDRVLTDAKDLIKIHRLLIEHGGIIPDDEKAAVAECVSVLVNASVKHPKGDGTLYYGVQRYSKLLEVATSDLLTRGWTNLNHVLLPEYAHNMELAEFNEYVSGGWLDNSHKLMDMLVAIEGLKHDIVLMNAAAPEASAEAYDLPQSRSRSLPESISQRRVKQLMPKRRADDPDEYYAWSATEEAAPTDRSRFRSHAKMSKMSPGPPALTPLTPLTPKKRTAMLAELREACTVMKDMISMQRFDRMNKKALQLIVRLGPAGRSGAQHCYYVKNIYQLWANAAKNNQPMKDPLTRAPVSEAKKDEIMSKVRRLRPNAPDPRDYAEPRDKKLKLDIKHIVEGAIGFYEISVRRPVGKRTFIIKDLGYVPSDIELADVDGDANLTSSAVIGNIQALFDSGRLMESNVIPYKCCRIHMNKSIEYWVTQTSGSPVVHFINMRRWKLLATEVYDNL
jgi:hypothetical protein